MVEARLRALPRPQPLSALQASRAMILAFMLTPPQRQSHQHQSSSASQAPGHARGWAVLFAGAQHGVPGHDRHMPRLREPGSTCSAIAYTCGLSSPSGTPLYCVIIRAPYRCRRRLCGFACAHAHRSPPHERTQANGGRDGTQALWQVGGSELTDSSRVKGASVPGFQGSCMRCVCHMQAVRGGAQPTGHGRAPR